MLENKNINETITVIDSDNGREIDNNREGEGAGDDVGN